MSDHSGVADIGHDPDALEAFYRTHLDDVQRFVARRVSSPHDAADLTADVFFEAIRSCGTFRADRGSASAWLCGIARNVIATHRRNVHRSRRVEHRLPARDWLDDEATERIAARIDAEAASRTLLESFADLPPRQRAVVELVAVDGLSLADAAVALRISATNARVRYHRARQRLMTTHPIVLEVNP